MPCRSNYRITLRAEGLRPSALLLLINLEVFRFDRMITRQAFVCGPWGSVLGCGGDSW